MPYILKTEREWIDKQLERLLKCAIGLHSGEINYVVTKILLSTNPTRYDDFNSLIGVLECIKQELYRRMVAPYEDKKKEENGDVFR